MWQFNRDENVCYCKKSKETLGPMRNNLDIELGAIDCTGTCYQDGIVYTDKESFGNIKKYTSPVHCHLACLKEENCKAWSYARGMTTYYSDGACILSSQDS